MDRLFRKSYITLLLLSIYICTISVMVAGNDEELFLRGNKLYAQKKYDDAYNEYNMISKKGCAVFYNMGNCLFYKDDYAQAFIYWLRAERDATPEEYRLIEHNKKHVLTLMGKQNEISLYYKIRQLLDNALPYTSLLFLQICTLICWYLLFLVWQRKRTLVKNIIVSYACFLMIISGVLLGMHYSNQQRIHGVVVKKEAQFFVGPDNGLSVVASLSYADNVLVKEIRQGWYKIQYAGMIGWVGDDVVQIV
ncbi:MAG TPA: hypothetical protein VLB80_03895 [Candidatus Babeliales bacterium]|nr:hypothetical protein [Candidatus Babeliales bacterium]